MPGQGEGSARAYFAASRRRLLERLSAVFLLALVHAALFMMLNPTFPPRMEPRTTEIVLRLLQPQPKTIERIPIAPEFAAPEMSPTAPNPPRTYPPPISTPLQTELDVAGLGHSLFDCTLGSTNNLSSEQRAHCAALAIPRAFSGTAEVGMPRMSRAAQSVRWAAALALYTTPPDATLGRILFRWRRAEGVLVPIFFLPKG